MTCTYTKSGILIVLALYQLLTQCVVANELPLTPRVYDTETFVGSMLVKSGEAVRKQFFFRIYTAAHFIDLPARLEGDDEDLFSVLVSQILSGQHLQQIDIVFARDLKAEQIKSALDAAIKRNCTSEHYNQIYESLVTFKQGITEDAKNGKHFSLRWYPNGRLQAMYETHSVIDIVDPLFARLLWSVWFGENAVVDRRELLSHLL